jgi:hypothetical protein
MKKFINFCISFALFITIRYINEDWSDYTKLGKLYYYPFWFVRSCLVWLFCPIFIPEYLFKQTSIYAYIKKLEEDPQFKTQMAKSMKFLYF